ncbi:cyclic nucleotide-gated cation channel beta-3-like isoform X2 [Lineus longissimus]|uniref:cyclic nucleotide-gated cation channel beta-3-like isoform X2 n=1 Tax=Lineus longissimus TaxID=88925 RepID=UPI00315CB799
MPPPLESLKMKRVSSENGKKEPPDLDRAPASPLLPPSVSLTPSGIENPVFTFENIQLFPPSRPVSTIEEFDAHISSNGSLPTGGKPPKSPTKHEHRLSIPNKQLLGVHGNNLAARRGQGLPPVQVDPGFHPFSPGPLAPSPGGLSTRSTRSNWSELMHLKKKDSSASFNSDSGSMKSMSMSGMSSVMSERLKELRRKFTSRTEHVKERTAQPPTPSSSTSDLEAEVKSGASASSPGALKPPPQRNRLNSLFPGGSVASGNVLNDDIHFIGVGHCKIKCPRWLKAIRFPAAIDPQSKFYIVWLFIVTLAFMYNAWVVPLRWAFKHLVQTSENLHYWWACDYLADFIYIVDILFFESRLIFISNGVFEKDPKLMRKNYFKKLVFKIDLLCLFPLELLYLIQEVQFNSLCRLPRLLKIPTFWEFYERFDQAAKSGHVIRIMKTMTYMVYLIHVEACGYYWVSYMEGFSTKWTFQKKEYMNVTAYIRCFYVATKTATSIGKNPIPTNDLEYVFMIVYWLSGVFVFALLIGQIRDIFEAAGQQKSEYRKTMDITLWYMQSLNLPKELQGRVRMWFNYNWDQQKTLNENSLIDALPKKMKTDLAINVHFQTLTKVQLFQDCDKTLLYDLILKLKPVLYLPGDYICRKGEVGTEMYIVMSGQVQVVGGLNNDIVFATLHEGSVFGEISLLALAGGNRRTADVRSKGFSNLFLLSKADFEEAMSDYPSAASLLKKRAKKLLSQNKKHEKKEQEDEESEDIIKSREPTPKMVKAVIQLLEPTSKVAEVLQKGKKRKKRLKRNKVSPVDNHEEKPPVRRKLARSITDEMDRMASLEDNEEEDHGYVGDENGDDDDDDDDDEDDDGDDVKEQSHDDDPVASIFGSQLDLDAISQVSEDIINLPDQAGSNPSLRQEPMLEDKALDDILDSNKLSEDLKTLSPSKALQVQIHVEEEDTRPLSKLSKDSFNHEMAELMEEIERTSQSLPTPSKVKPRMMRLVSSDSDSPELVHYPRSRPISVEMAPALVQIEKEVTELQIPKENRIVCDVEVHREKTPSMNENTGGFDNPAFVPSDSCQSLKNVLERGGIKPS